MIRVVKRIEKKYIRCTKCNKLLEFQNEDVNLEEEYKLSFYNYIICPVCKGRVKIGFYEKFD